MGTGCCSFGQELSNKSPAEQQLLYNEEAQPRSNEEEGSGALDVERLEELEVKEQLKEQALQHLQDELQRRDMANRSAVQLVELELHCRQKAAQQAHNAEHCWQVQQVMAANRKLPLRIGNKVVPRSISSGTFWAYAVQPGSSSLAGS